MAVRTTAAKVKEIMQTGLEDAEIDSLIAIANRMVDRQLDGEGLTTALLTDIETYVTAHLISIGKERQTVSEKIGEVWITFHKNPQGFFDQTTFGQTALFMDPSGQLQAAAMKKATFRAIYQSETDDT